MPLARLQTGRRAQTRPDTPAGGRRWSIGLFLAMAGAWSFVALAFFASWLPEAEPGGPSWVSEAIWYGDTYFLWFLLSPLVFFLSKAIPVRGEEVVRNLSIHLVAAIVLAMAHALIFISTDRLLDPDAHLRYPSLAVALKDNFIYRSLTGTVTYGVVLFVFATDAAHRQARLEAHRFDELQRQLAEAQLQTLRMQIQPHFLFNTLHSISALIYESPAQALTMVSRLGDFLRATLERGAVQTVRFEDELRFAELYLDIEKVRFGDRMRITIEVAPEVLGAETPTLILQPLIENAVRHGVAPAMGRVDLAVEAASRGGNLVISLRNCEPGADPARPRSAPGGGGLGLHNTHARLRRMYGDAASLRCEAPTPGSFEATLQMPMRELADADG